MACRFSCARHGSRPASPFPHPFEVDHESTRRCPTEVVVVVREELEVGDEDEVEEVGSVRHPTSAARTATRRGAPIGALWRLRYGAEPGWLKLRAGAELLRAGVRGTLL